MFFASCLALASVRMATRTDANAPRRPSARYFVSLSMTRDVRVNCYIISKNNYALLRLTLITSRTCHRDAREATSMFFAGAMSARRRCWRLAVSY